MTNTRITDPESLEKQDPVLLREFSIRDGSGGKGRCNGGNGTRRVYQFYHDMNASIVSERRIKRPCGMFGGEDGSSGVDYIVKKVGVWCKLGGRKDFSVQKADCIVVYTPGGGGWGVKSEYEEDSDENRGKVAVERRFVSQFQLAQKASN